MLCNQLAKLVLGEGAPENGDLRETSRSVSLLVFSLLVDPSIDLFCFCFIFFWVCVFLISVQLVPLGDGLPVHCQGDRVNL